MLRSISEPVPPASFLTWLKEEAATLRAPQDPQAFVTELIEKLLKNDFMKEALKDALTRWLLLSSDDPGFDERMERLKRDGELDAEGFSAFLGYVTARAERAEELFVASLGEKKTQ